MEFIAVTPPASTQSAQRVTNNINTASDGDCDPTRPLAQLATTPILKRLAQVPAHAIAPTASRRFSKLASAPINACHKLYFDENNNTNEFCMSPG